MTSVECNPSARFDIETTGLVRLEHEGVSLEATNYQPQGEDPFPGLLDVHGGRWLLNDPSNGRHMNSALAASGIAVAAVDFRLAPQHAYPAQIIDTNYAIRWMKAQAGQPNIDPSSVGAMDCSGGGYTVAPNGMRPEDPLGASVPLPVGGDFEASVRFLLCCWPVPDPQARYKWAVEIGEKRFTGPMEDSFGDHANLHEGTLQEALDRGEAAELPPMIIIRGANDSNIPPFIPHKFEASYRQAGATWSWNCSRGCPISSATRQDRNPTGPSS
jgi:hypothetical protein